MLCKEVVYLKERQEKEGESVRSKESKRRRRRRMNVSVPDIPQLGCYSSLINVLSLVSNEDMFDGQSRLLFSQVSDEVASILYPSLSSLLHPHISSSSLSTSSPDFFSSFNVMPMGW